MFVYISETHTFMSDFEKRKHVYNRPFPPPTLFLIYLLPVTPEALFRIIMSSRLGATSKRWLFWVVTQMGGGSKVRPQLLVKKNYHILFLRQEASKTFKITINF